MKRTVSLLHAEVLPEIPAYMEGNQELLFQATKNCIDHKIIDTDRAQLARFLLELDIVTGEDWSKHVEHIYGFFKFNEDDSGFEACVFFNSSKETLQCAQCGDRWCHMFYREIKYCNEPDENGGTFGYVISLEPLLITFELGQTWGYLFEAGRLIDKEVCSPDVNLHDWKIESD